MKSLLVTMHFPRSEEVPPTKALVEGLTDAILFCLADGLGMDTAQENATQAVMPLVEGDVDSEVFIGGCFDQGYEPEDDEGYETVTAKRLKDGRFSFDGNGAEVRMTVARWKPDENRRTELAGMSQEDLIQRVLELEAVL